MQKYFKKYETWVPPMDGRNDSALYDAQYHGTDGPVGVSISNNNYAYQNTIMSAAGAMEGFEFNQDVDGDTMLGMGWTQMNQGVSL